MLLKTKEGVRNEARKYLKTTQLYVNEGGDAKKYLKTTEIVS